MKSHFQAPSLKVWPRWCRTQRPNRWTEFWRISSMETILYSSLATWPYLTISHMFWIMPRVSTASQPLCLETFNSWSMCWQENGAGQTGLDWNFGVHACTYISCLPCLKVLNLKWCPDIKNQDLLPAYLLAYCSMWTLFEIIQSLMLNKEFSWLLTPAFQKKVLDGTV